MTLVELETQVKAIKAAMPKCNIITIPAKDFDACAADLVGMPSCLTNFGIGDMSIYSGASEGRAIYEERSAGYTFSHYGDWPYIKVPSAAVPPPFCDCGSAATQQPGHSSWCSTQQQVSA